MAIKITKQIKGIEREWYIKIFDSKGANKGDTVQTYGYFLNEVKALNYKNAIEIMSFDFIATVNKDIFEQGYEHLKTLEEFKNAIDC